MASPGSLPLHLLAPSAPVELSAATSDMFDSPQARGRIATCSKSCRLPVLTQPPNSSGPKNKKAGKPADYVFRAARPRSARVRVPVKLQARPRSPCLQTPWPSRTAPEPRQPCLDGLELCSRHLVAGWRGEVGLKARRIWGRNLAPLRDFSRRAPLRSVRRG